MEGKEMDEKKSSAIREGHLDTDFSSIINNLNLLYLLINKMMLGLDKMKLRCKIIFSEKLFLGSKLVLKSLHSILWNTLLQSHEYFS